MKHHGLFILLFAFILCTPVKERLCVCDADDCKIVGITKNGKKYLVLDGCGGHTHKVKPEEAPDSSKIGQYLICLDEFDK